MQGLAEMEIAVGADRPASQADLSAGGNALPHVLSTAGDLRQPLVLGQANEDPLDVLIDGRGEQGQRFALGSSGLKAGSLASEARTLCSSAVTEPRLPSSVSRDSGSEPI